MVVNSIYYFSSIVSTRRLLKATEGPLVDSVDQDQTAQNVQSDLGSTLTYKVLLSPPPPPPQKFEI